MFRKQAARFLALMVVVLAGCSQVSDAPTATPSLEPTLTEQPTEEPATIRPSRTPAPSPAPTKTSTAIPPSPTDTLAPEPSKVNFESDRFASPEYGVQAFMWWRPEVAERDLSLVNELGFQWVKQSFAWRDIETLEKGKYDWWRPDKIVDMAEEAGVKLLVRIDRQPFWSQEEPWPPLENAPPADLRDFSDFCQALAQRYEGRIAAYQIWNEPNLSREWGENPPDPGEYVEMLKVCYRAIKAVDPQAIVVSAGLAPTGTDLPLAMPDTIFLEQMYEEGAADYFDVLGLNAPGYKAPPETAPEEGELNSDFGGGRWFVYRHVEDMRAIMEKYGDDDKQVSILELGWTTDSLNPSYAWHAVTEEQQADYLVRAYRYARDNWQPWIGPIFTIYLADYDWTPEEHEQWWWAITLPDGSPRPAFEALKAMEK